MAHTRLKMNKNGQRYYEIMVSRGRGQSYVTRRWPVPDGWSKRAIEKELATQAAELERQVKAGEVVTRKEQKERDRIAAEKAAEEEARQKAEAAKIVTVRDFGEKVFMPSLAVHCAENTRASFQTNLDRNIYPVLGNLKMPEVMPAQINALLLDFQASGKAHGTCIKLYTVPNMLFKRAYMDDVIDRNPMDKVQRPSPTKAEGKDKEIPFFAEDELNHIKECLEKEPLKWRALVLLLMDSGMRRGEALALTWDSVDFKESTVTVRQSLNYTPQRGVFAEPPKSGKNRTVYIDPDVMKLLKEMRTIQMSAEVIDMQAAQAGFVFTQDNGITPMFPTSPTRYFKQFGKRYGIEDFHPHKLRHSFASVAIKNGADIAVVSECLGHSDKGVTLKMYTHSDAEAQKAASNKFRDALKTKQA